MRLMKKKLKTEQPENHQLPDKWSQRLRKLLLREQRDLRRA